MREVYVGRIAFDLYAIGGGGSGEGAAGPKAAIGGGGRGEGAAGPKAAIGGGGSGEGAAGPKATIGGGGSGEGAAGPEAKANVNGTTTADKMAMERTGLNIRTSPGKSRRGCA